MIEAPEPSRSKECRLLRYQRSGKAQHLRDQEVGAGCRIHEIAAALLDLGKNRVTEQESTASPLDKGPPLKLGTREIAIRRHRAEPDSTILHRPAVILSRGDYNSVPPLLHNRCDCQIRVKVAKRTKRTENHPLLWRLY